MAKSNVSEKDTPRQEPIKHFEVGVVSYSLFRGFYHDVDTFLNRLYFLLVAGFKIDAYMETALALVNKLLTEAINGLDKIGERAVKESNEAGGNDIYTVSMNDVLKLKGRKTTGGEV